jgi:PEP-CTERM motif
VKVMKLRRLIYSASAAVLLMGAAIPANASLVFEGASPISAQGFGNANRLITIQVPGNQTTETAATSVINGTFTGTGDLAHPFSDNQKFGDPTLSQLGWTNASQVGLLFNAIETGGDSVTISALTLSFFNNTGLVESISIAAPVTIANTFPGNGSAGFLFGISSDEQAGLNAAVFNLAGSGNFRIGISSTITDVSAGPESFNAISVAPSIPEPSTWAMLLIGFAGIGFAAYRRRSLPTTS